MKAMRPWCLICVASLLCLAIISGCGDASTPAIEAKDTAAANSDAARLLADVGPAPSQPVLNANGAMVIISWPSSLPGDYNLDGVTSGLDLFPLAANFGAVKGEPEYSRCVDGNGDDTLNGLDLFTITVNFQQRIDRYEVYEDTAWDGDFLTHFNAVEVPYEGCGTAASYSFWYGFQGPWFAVRSYDAGSDTLSPLSDPVYAPVPPDNLNLSARGFDPFVTVDWDDTPKAGDTWNVYRGDDVAGPWTQINSAPLTTSAYNDTSAERAHTYHYRVSTIDADSGKEGPFCYSAEVNTPRWEYVFFGPEGRGRFSSIKFDDDDNPIMAYWSGDLGLFLGWHDGTAWHESEIDYGSPTVGAYPSLALDDGVPTVAYFDGGGLSVARSDPADWTDWTLLHLTDTGGAYNNLLFDSGGLPCISHHEYDVSLQYSCWGGSSWQHSTVDSTNVAGHSNALAFDGDGYPMIAYRGDGVLKFARYNGVKWSKQTIDSGGDPGWELSMVTDKHGDPSILYYDGTSETVKLAEWDGSAWDLSTVDDAHTALGWCSLKIDSRGFYIAAYKTDPRFIVAFGGPGDWEYDEPMVLDEAGYYLSMELDSKGHPLIAHYNVDTYEMHLCWFK